MTAVSGWPTAHRCTNTPLYEVGRDARMDRTVRMAVVCGSVSLGGVGAVAATCGLARPGAATMVLWAMVAVAVICAAVWAATTVLFARRSAATYAALADLSLAAALVCLNDASVMFVSCGLFIMLTVLTGLLLARAGLVLHVVFVSAYVIGAAVMVAHSTTRSNYLIGAATAMLLWIVIGLPIVVRRIWLGLSQAAELASFDPLTGVLNRAGLVRAYRQLAQYAESDGVAMVAVAVDLDNFKSVNDRFGHAVGDAVIIEAAQHLAHHFGRTAAVARCGGEEYTVIATGNRGHLDHLVHSLPTVTPGIHGPATTMSVGAVWCEDVRSDNSMLRAMTAADQAMYSAKNRGGNRLYAVLGDSP